MHKNLLVGTLVGALLSAGCSSDTVDPSKHSYPQPKIITPSAQAEATSYVTGYGFDPEAFLMNFVACGGPACPFPPLLLDSGSLYLASVVRGGPVTLLDPVTAQPAVPPGLTDTSGNWALPKVKSGPGPYLPLALGQGAQLATGVPVPPGVTLYPMPPSNYLPTLTLRPVSPLHNQCVAIESLHVSDNGVLEAVAKYLTLVEGTPTTVTDLINPAKYGGVMLFWLYIPGFSFLKAPPTPLPTDATQTNVTVKVLEAPPGSKVLNIQWAPKNDPRLPPAVLPLQSERGFFVVPGAPTSGLGIVAVLHAPVAGPALATYQVEDKVTEDASFRPWGYPPLQIPIIPGLITAASLQLNYRDAAPPSGSPGAMFCLPPAP